MLLVILKAKKLLERFTKKNSKQKTRKKQKEFRVEKVIKRKGNRVHVKWKGYDSSLSGCVNKKGIISRREYFPEPTPSGERVKVELDLCNKSRFKNCNRGWYIKIC